MDTGNGAGKGTAMRALARLPWLRGEVTPLLLVQAVRAFTLALLGVTVPLYVATAGYSTLQVGYLLSAGALGSTGLLLLVGLYGDRYGRRQVQIWLALGAAAACVAFALTTSLGVLIPAVAFMAIGSGMSAGSSGTGSPSGPPMQAQLTEACRPADRNTVFTALFFVGVLSGSVGAVAATLPGFAPAGTGQMTAYRLLFCLGAVVALAQWPLLARTRESRPSHGGRRPSRAARGLVGRLWVTNSLTGISAGVMGPFLTYWFHLRFGVGPGQLGGLYALTNLLVAASACAALPLARPLGLVRVIVVTRFFVTAGITAMIFAPTFALAATFYVARLCVGAVTVPLRQSFVMGVSEEQSRTAVAAFGSLPSQLTGSFAPSLSAWLVEVAGFGAPLVVAAATQMANAVAYFGLFRRIAPPEEQAARAARARRAART